jgi:uncharacterized protein (TIGR01777 family)
MRIAITGSTGLVGTALTRAFRKDGHDITRVVRSFSGLSAAERPVVWHPDEGVIDAHGLEDHDVVIHLAGESLAGVWTDAKKKRIRSSRVRGTTLLATALRDLEKPPAVFISASGFDYYGDRPPDEVLDEGSAPGTGFLPEVVQAWEDATKPAATAATRVVQTRFGNVLSPHGGMLATILPLFRLGLAAKFGNGRQLWPWIALDEMAPAMMHVINETDLAGKVNFVAPDIVSNAQFTDAVAAAVGRPSFLTVPSFAAKLAPGGMSEELLLRGARVVPARLLETGYEFRHPELRGALRSMLG